jgi:HlyD family secretion protein
MKPVLIFSFCLLLAGCAADEESAPAPVVDVKVAKAELANVRLTVEAPAVIYPREQANVASRVTAPIRKLGVRKGDAVTAGQVLAQLENRDLLAQRDEAAAAVVDAEANLQKISAGTLPTDVERARGQVATAEAALNQAQKIYDRRQELFREGAIPNRDLLLSQTELAQAKTAYQVAKKSLELLEGQSRERDIRMAESRLKQARARLDLINAQLEFTTIRSPFSGTVTEQFLYPGDMAKPDSPIFTVMDLSVAVARAQVPEANAAALRLGQPCAFTSLDSGGVAHEGRVSVVNQVVDPAQRTVETWCVIPNAKHALRGGVFGTATITTGVDPKSVVVPVPAVQFVEGTQRGVVYLAGNDHHAVRRDVETGVRFGGMVQIKQGVSAGDLVITEGGYGLQDGTEIRWAEGDKP